MLISPPPDALQNELDKAGVAAELVTKTPGQTRWGAWSV